MTSSSLCCRRVSSRDVTRRLRAQFSARLHYTVQLLDIEMAETGQESCMRLNTDERRQYVGVGAAFTEKRADARKMQINCSVQLFRKHSIDSHDLPRDSYVFVSTSTH